MCLKTVLNFDKNNSRCLSPLPCLSKCKDDIRHERKH